MSLLLPRESQKADGVSNINTKWPLSSVKSCFSFFRRRCHFICIYFWLCWVFIAACGLSLVAVSWGYTLLRCVGFSLRWLLLWQRTGFRCVGFSSCGTRAQ